MCEKLDDGGGLRLLGQQRRALDQLAQAQHAARAQEGLGVLLPQRGEALDAVLRVQMRLIRRDHPHEVRHAQPLLAQLGHARHLGGQDARVDDDIIVLLARQRLVNSDDLLDAAKRARALADGLDKGGRILRRWHEQRQRHRRVRVVIQGHRAQPVHVVGRCKLACHRVEEGAERAGDVRPDVMEYLVGRRILGRVGVDVNLLRETLDAPLLCHPPREAIDARKEERRDDVTAR